MLTYESSASIAASRERVWRVLSDVASWPEWLPTVTKVEPLDEIPLRLGARFVIHQPRLRPATWTVSEIEAAKHFAWVARSPGVQMVAEHTIVEDSPRSSTVRLRFSFGGPVGGVLGRLFGAVTQSYLAQEAASLKRKVEASGERGP